MSGERHVCPTEIVYAPLTHSRSSIRPSPPRDRIENRIEDVKRCLLILTRSPGMSPAWGTWSRMRRRRAWCIRSVRYSRRSLPHSPAFIFYFHFLFYFIFKWCSDVGGRYFQVTEALLVCGIKPAQIGIISLYRQQIKLLSHVLRGHKEIELLTADRSQGRDKDCIIISMVKSNASGQVGVVSSSCFCHIIFCPGMRNGVADVLLLFLLWCCCRWCWCWCWCVVAVRGGRLAIWSRTGDASTCRLRVRGQSLSCLARAGRCAPRLSWPSFLI